MLVADDGSPLDVVANFETASQSSQNIAAPVRYAIRQALDQQYQKYLIQKNAEARQARYRAGTYMGSDPQPETSDHYLPAAEKKKLNHAGVKRDFFGRIIDDIRSTSSDHRASDKRPKNYDGQQQEDMVWVSFHEGSSTAVRKPITLEELMKAF